jgi:hypothetical protein
VQVRKQPEENVVPQEGFLKDRPGLEAAARKLLFLKHHILEPLKIVTFLLF